MGLFKKKKALPQGGFPKGRFPDHKELKFPSTPPPQRVIEPEHIKEAAGIKKMSEQPPEPSKLPLLQPKPVKQMKMPTPEEFAEPTQDTLYVKMNVYQRVLGEIEGLKSQLNKFNATYREIQSSEYNEESHLEKLKRSVKLMHDRLLYADKILFKPQG